MIKDVCFNDPRSTFYGVELRSLGTIFRATSREYKPVEAAPFNRHPSFVLMEAERY